ncbi:MAG: Heme exporter protein [Xanthomonadaceae bacterium]|nr:Heme exporter protein [Xanthomonadaceae bacterium]
MTYFNYVVAAYMVFAVVMLWDFVVPRLQLRAQLRAARLRVVRQHEPRATSSELLP